MRNARGQILLPGLAIFWALMMLFLALVGYGRHVLLQMRVNMAAEAVALSAARAQAEMLNKFASYNLLINPMLFPKYKGYAALQKPAQPALKVLADYQLWRQLPQFQVFPRNVGRRVAMVNGCDPNPKFIPTSSGLILQDMEVQLMLGIKPASLGPVEIDNVYYVRTWGPDKRKAQPPHKTFWMVSKDGVRGTAGARLYLDVQADESWQNGGFPSANPENWWDDAQIQSFYPQFNACLLAGTPRGFKILLEHL
jgi:hypothetical protein